MGADDLQSFLGPGEHGHGLVEFRLLGGKFSANRCFLGSKRRNLALELADLFVVAGQSRRQDTLLLFGVLQVLAGAIQFTLKRGLGWTDLGEPEGSRQQHGDRCTARDRGDARLS